MTKIIAMLVICFVPTKDGQLREAWRIEEQVTVEHCLTMNKIFSGGGVRGAITVRCGQP